MYTITYKVHSYLPFKWEKCPLVGYFTDKVHLLNDKVTTLASGEIFCSVIIIHLKQIYS